MAVIDLPMNLLSREPGSRVNALRVKAGEAMSRSKPGAGRSHGEWTQRAHRGAEEKRAMRGRSGAGSARQRAPPGQDGAARTRPARHRCCGEADRALGSVKTHGSRGLPVTKPHPIPARARPC